MTAFVCVQRIFRIYFQSICPNQSKKCFFLNNRVEFAEKFAGGENCRDFNLSGIMEWII